MNEQTDRLNTALAGRYRIERHVGEGGMATVYLAEDLRHKRKVALKLLKPELAAVLGADRFVQEITTTASLQHPHILALFDSGTADGFLFYVMPYIEGETLRDKLNRETQLGVDEAVRIAREVLDALDYAHQHGIVHRDVKPENILLHGGHAMVADFGIALAVSAAAGGRMTETGLSLGTPHYMSPEQATAEKEITARSDVYSLGSVLYEMLTGQPPHHGGSAQQIIMKIITTPAEAVTVHRKSVPPNVAAAVAKSLEKLPADRFESAKAFSDALGNPAYANATVAGVAPMTAIMRPRRVTTAAVVVVAIVGGIGIAAGFGIARLAAPPSDGSDLTVRFAFAPPLDQRFTGNVPGFAISPDGKVITYRGIQADGSTQLFMHRIDEMTTHPLAGANNGSYPFFSGDGKWIGFSAASRLLKIASDGGAALPVAENVSAANGGDWLPNGDMIMGGTSGGLFIVPASGGPRRPLTHVDSAHGETAHRFPRVLDDGRTVVFASMHGPLANTRIGVASLADGSAHVLNDLVGTYPLGLIDGRLIYASVTGQLLAVPFDARGARTTGTPIPVVDQVVVGGSGSANAALSRSGTLMYSVGDAMGQLALADAHGGTKPAIDSLRAYLAPRFSPDGRRIALQVTSHGAQDIWVYDIAARTFDRLTTEGNSAFPEWSPDGKDILFRSNRGGINSLWRQSADGSAPAQLVLNGADDGAFAPDGRGIVFTRSQKLYYRPGATDTIPKAIAVSPTPQWAPRVSPDGRWVAYSSEESGKSQVYVRPFPNLGARYQISVDGGAAPVWSRDARRLFYTVTGRLVIAVSFTATPVFAVTHTDTVFKGEFAPYSPHADYDVSPDGSHVLLVLPVASAQWLVVHNWRAELRAKLRGR